MQGRNEAARRGRGGRRRVATAVLAWAALSSGTAAADWQGKGEGGVLLSRGNSDATSANLKLALSREVGDWKQAVQASVLYGENAEFTTAQRYEARYELQRALGERLYAFGSLRGERDRFSGFDYQATVSAGVGYRFIAEEDAKLTGTLGAGYRRLRPQELVKLESGEVVARLPGPSSGDAVATAGLDYEQRLTANTRLTDRLLVEAGADNTSVSNDLALQVAMSDRLALAVGYGVRYNTDPAPGTRKTDQVTTLNLVYTID